MTNIQTGERLKGQCGRRRERCVEGGEGNLTCGTPSQSSASFMASVAFSTGFTGSQVSQSGHRPANKTHMWQRRQRQQLPDAQQLRFHLWTRRTRHTNSLCVVQTSYSTNFDHRVRFYLMSLLIVLFKHGVEILQVYVDIVRLSNFVFSTDNMRTSCWLNEAVHGL